MSVLQQLPEAWLAGALPIPAAAVHRCWRHLCSTPSAGCQSVVCRTPPPLKYTGARFDWHPQTASAPGRLHASVWTQLPRYAEAVVSQIKPFWHVYSCCMPQQCCQKNMQKHAKGLGGRCKTCVLWGAVGVCAVVPWVWVCYAPTRPQQ